MASLTVNIQVKEDTRQKIFCWLLDNYSKPCGTIFYEMLQDSEKQQLLQSFCTRASLLYGVEPNYVTLELRHVHRNREYKDLLLFTRDFDFTINRPEYGDTVNINNVMI